QPELLCAAWTYGGVNIPEYPVYSRYSNAIHTSPPSSQTPTSSAPLTVKVPFTYGGSAQRTETRGMTQLISSTPGGIRISRRRTACSDWPRSGRQPHRGRSCSSTHASADHSC